MNWKNFLRRIYDDSYKILSLILLIGILIIGILWIIILLMTLFMGKF